MVTCLVQDNYIYVCLLLNFETIKPSYLQMITIILDKFDRLFSNNSLQKSFTSPAAFQSIQKSADIGENSAIFYSWDFLAVVNGCRRQKGPLIQAENPWMTDVCTKFKSFLDRKNMHWLQESLIHCRNERASSK